MALKNDYAQRLKLYMRIRGEDKVPDTNATENQSAVDTKYSGAVDIDFDSIKYFANGNDIKPNKNPDLNEDLYQAIEKADYDNVIFYHPDITALTVSLWQDKRITPTQARTILFLESCKRAGMQLVKAIPILEDNKLSNEFSQYYSFIKEKIVISTPSKDICHDVKEILCFPVSEQRIFLFKKAQNDYSPTKFLKTIYLSIKSHFFFTGYGDRILSDTVSLAFAYASINSGELLIPSQGYFQYFYDKQSNHKSRIAFITGKVTIDQIEQAVRSDIRPAFCPYPGVIEPQSLHGILECSTFHRTTHDYWHMAARALTPKAQLDIAFEWIRLIRELTRIKWSKAIWQLVDWNNLRAGYKIVWMPANKDYKTTKIFCDYLNNENESLESLGAAAFYRRKPTIALYILLLDVYEHPDKWAKFELNTEYLSGAMLDIYKEISTNYKRFCKPEMPDIVKLFCIVTGLPCNKIRQNQIRFLKVDKTYGPLRNTLVLQVKLQAGKFVDASLIRDMRLNRLTPLMDAIRFANKYFAYGLSFFPLAFMLDEIVNIGTTFIADDKAAKSTITKLALKRTPNILLCVFLLMSSRNLQKFFTKLCYYRNSVRDTSQLPLARKFLHQLQSNTIQPSAIQQTRLVRDGFTRDDEKSERKISRHRKKLNITI